MGCLGDTVERRPLTVVAFCYSSASVLVLPVRTTTSTTPFDTRSLTPQKCVRDLPLRSSSDLSTGLRVCLNYISHPSSARTSQRGLCPKRADQLILKGENLGKETAAASRHFGEGSTYMYPKQARLQPKRKPKRERRGRGCGRVAQVQRVWRPAPLW